MLLLQLITTIFVVVAGCVCLYHALLAVVGLCMRARPHDCGDHPIHSFAVLIPAHNEASGIEDTLRSCFAMDYPREKYAVCVIADNCTDDTAGIATAMGAHSLIRRDPEHPGKGHALEWAFARLLPEKHDAFFVLDADCRISSNALRECDRQLQSGQQALQTENSVANPDESVMSYMLALANTLENKLFYAPKSQLGLSVFLRGTGMVLHRDLLSRFPWKTGSIAEDTEYSYRLLEGGADIRFLHGVTVTSDFPVQKRQLVVQRNRWISGNSRIATTRSMGLVWRGVLHQNGLLIDAAWTIWIVSRPLILIQLFVTLLLTCLCISVAFGPWSRVLLLSTLSFGAVYMCYVAAGVAKLGVTLRRIQLLIQTPFAVGYYMYVALRSFVGSGASVWTRTPRLKENDAV